MPIISSPVERYHSDQLIVDLPYLDSVIMPKLREFEVDSVGIDREPTLGLARLTVDPQSLKKAAETIFIPKYGEAAEKAQSPAYGNRGRIEIPDIDLLMTAMRTEFTLAYGDWSPAIGKGRVVDAVEGSPGISGGGGGDPEPPTVGLAAFTIPAASAGANGHTVRVGMVDTQMVSSSALSSRTFTYSDPYVPQSPATPLAGHATFVASQIARRAPDAEIIVRSVLNEDEARGSLWEAAKQMVRFRDSGISVLNLSWFFSAPDHEPSLTLTRAIDLLTPGVVIVAASGNHGGDDDQAGDGRVLPNKQVQPASLPGIVSVGALDKTRTKAASFTPRNAPWITLMAPGEELQGIYLNGDVKVVRRDAVTGSVLHNDDGHVLYTDTPKRFAGSAIWSGTSFAAANVTGKIAALMADGLTAQEAAGELLHGLPGSDIKPYSLGDVY